MDTKLIFGLLLIYCNIINSQLTGDKQSALDSLFAEEEDTQKPDSNIEASSIEPPVDNQQIPINSNFDNKCKENQICVPYHNCDSETGKIIIDMDSQKPADIRFDSPKCPHYLEVCCIFDPSQPKPNFSMVEPPTIQPNYGQDNPEMCGKRNKDGIGFTVRDNLADEAQFAEFPWMIQILKRNSGTPESICGGSLIHYKIVLTAAHCLRKSIRDEKRPEELIVRGGEWDIQTTKEAIPFQERNVQKIIIHNKFDPVFLYYDAALLVLEMPFYAAPNIGTLCLPNTGDGSQFNGVRDCFISGWGKDAFDTKNRTRTNLKKVDLPMISYNQCQQLLRLQPRLSKNYNLHSSFICAGGEAGKDACQGDGGGPLFCPDKLGQYSQVGIISWGIGCGGKDVPGIYTNVPLIRDWIDIEMGKEN